MLSGGVGRVEVGGGGGAQGGDDLAGGPGGVGGAKQGGGPGDEGRRGAGAHGLNIGVWPRLKQPKLWALSAGGPSEVLGRPLEQAPRIHPLTAVSGSGVAPSG